MRKILLPFLFIIFDLLTGGISAVKNGEFTSSKMREGLFHKLASVLIILLGKLIEITLPYYNIEYGDKIYISIVTYIIIMEISSIVENVGKINPKLLPNVIKKVFKNIPKEEGKNE